MTLRNLLKYNYYLIYLYRIRSLLVITLCIMAYDITYKSWTSLVIPFIAVFLYLVFFYYDGGDKLLKKYKKWFYSIISILSVVFTTWLNIIANQEIISITGYSYTNFNNTSNLLSLIVAIILLFPIGIMISLCVSIFYEFRLFYIISIRKNITKILHLSIMFFIGTSLLFNLTNKVNEFIYNNIGVIFKSSLVYSAYSDIPDRCNNKNKLKIKYGENVQIAFINERLISIAYYNDFKWYFTSNYCE
ncbi:hypothetical protein NYR68_09085 [Actinobacillus equuli subsp. haemolyticus]|uniref:hypothetical protein n=1 Tax=Actinobacillus equuli TaxID=718 RepID=UPI0024465E1D|nr:hypothetical protein [Actinobacillus equuli]WGE50410.1 hypothetical protein NYR68_09085 [Actinobacillus equuli subsp. haemolyticus]